MNRKTIGALVAAIVVIAAIAGAVVLYSPPTTTSGGEKVTVVMPYRPAMGMSAFYCALDQGYYADEGLNVTIQHTSEGSMGPIKQVGAGNAEFGFPSGSSVIVARSKGVPVVMVYQTDQVYPYIVIARKISGITKMGDLIGKRVAIPGTGCPQQIAIEAALAQLGLDYHKVIFVPTSGQEITALLQNKTDAMGGHIFHKLLLESMGKGDEINVIYARDYVDFVGNGIITSEKILKENPDLVKKFVRATDKGFRFAINNPDKATDIYIKNWAPQYAKKRDFHLDFWKTMIKEVYQPDKYPLGKMREEQWKETQDILYDLGLIDHKIDLSKAYTNEFVPSAVE